MRVFVSTLLSILLLACPFLCGADEIGHQARHEHASSSDGQGDSDDANAPDHCPGSSDNCVCRGAVPSIASRADLAEFGAWVPLLLTQPPLFSTCLHHHLSWKGSPTGLAGWGDALTVRAFLQNYRC